MSGVRRVILSGVRTVILSGVRTVILSGVRTVILSGVRRTVIFHLAIFRKCGKQIIKIPKVLLPYIFHCKNLEY